MQNRRKIIEIDDEKCTGCGECMLACAEGALELVDGKAKLVGDIYCDGLGACIGECPEGALKVIERDAEEFDEAAVEELLKERDAESKPVENPMACGCPGSTAMTMERSGRAGSDECAGEIASELGHWPIKLQLLNPKAPFLKGADLLLLADCAAAAYPDLHRKLLRGHAVAMGCPKLDDLEAHINKLAQVLEEACPKSLTVAHMEVPCCKGFMFAAEKAIELAGVDMPLHCIVIARAGEVLSGEGLVHEAAC